jgi:hypothetical protein
MPFAAPYTASEASRITGTRRRRTRQARTAQRTSGPSSHGSAIANSGSVALPSKTGASGRMSAPDAASSSRWPMAPADAAAKSGSQRDRATNSLSPAAVSAAHPSAPASACVPAWWCRR